MKCGLCSVQVYSMWALCCGLAWLATGCLDGQPFATGQEAPLQVAGGVFYAGSLPSSAAGPDVRALYLSTRSFAVGTQGKAFSGALAPEATAVAVALAPEAGYGEAGYWVVPAGSPAVATPTLPSFTAPLSFADDLLPGAYALRVVAFDADGVAGNASEVQFELGEAAAPQGELVFALSWDRDADLDLRVVTPDGVEIYQGDVREGADAQGGYLDFDSNGDCRIDGRRKEHVVWETAPPAGTYVVRVDSFALCEERSARWRATATYQGKLVAAVRGTSLPSDTRFDHGRGAGVTAFELTVE